MKNHNIWLSLMLALGLAQVGPVAAQTDGFISACVNNSSGGIRIVPDPDDCRNNETLLQWSATTQAAGSFMVVDADGEPVGYLSEHNSRYLTVLTEKGYAFFADPATGLVGSDGVFFESDDCTGSAFARNTQQYGWIAGCFGERGCYYSPQTVPEPEYLAFGSELYFGTCSSGPRGQVAVPALPNDPAVTGFEPPPGGSFPVPLSIERR